MTSDFVTLSVPSDLYPAVIRFVAANLEPDDATAEPAADPTPEPSAATKGWKPEDVPRLRVLLEGNKTAITLLDLTSARPGERFTFRQVSEHSGRTIPESRADLRSLTMKIRKHFNHDQWPVIVTWTPNGEISYEALPAIARAWLETRN